MKTIFFKQTLRNTFSLNQLTNKFLSSNGTNFLYRIQLRTFAEETKSKSSKENNEEIVDPTPEEYKNFIGDAKYTRSDPHKFSVYKKIKPDFGKAPPDQPLPDYISNILPLDSHQKYHPIDHEDSMRIAIRENYPVYRQPVSSSYTAHVNGTNYYVYNAARYPVGRILSTSAILLQGKGSPHFRRNKVEAKDIIVIVNAATPYLTGRKAIYRKFYTPSPKPGNMKSISAKNLIKKSPKEFFFRSIKQMLPKNRLQDQFYKNFMFFEGPEHDLHKIGLPQFDTFKPYDFDKVFGISSDIQPADDVQVLHDEETNPELLEEYRKKGYKIKEDPESHLRSFMKRKTYAKHDPDKMRVYHEKMLLHRIGRLKKIRMKNFTYL